MGDSYDKDEWNDYDEEIEYEDDLNDGLDDLFPNSQPKILKTEVDDFSIFTERGDDGGLRNFGLSYNRVRPQVLASHHWNEEALIQWEADNLGIEHLEAIYDEKYGEYVYEEHPVPPDQTDYNTEAPENSTWEEVLNDKPGV
jgi:hypothetical protein